MPLFLAIIATLFALSASAEIVRTADVMIPMRDGVKLHTEIWRDSSQTGNLPFVLTRSPYGWSRAKSVLDNSYDDLARDGYIFVFQDIRGRYGSDGTFVMQRPVCPAQSTACVDEGTDTWDTLDWLLKNTPSNNGRAGILGVSYGGWLTMMALVHPHPALKAASEQASPADMFLGDDFHHKGAFRLSYGYEYASMMETGKENTQFKFDRYDTFEWYLRLGPLSEANRRYLDGARPTWNNFVAHPNYDSFWQQQEVGQFARNPQVPNLNVAGWFDQEDFYGPVRIYREAEKNDPGKRNYLVVGPWNHGGWSGGKGRSLGKFDFGSDTAAYYRREVQAPWFAYWLKGQGQLAQSEALCFQTGSNTWKRYDAWPPANVQSRRLYFQPDGTLSFQPPVAAGADEFVSDPAHPVSYRPRPIPPTYSPNSTWSAWLVDDQRFVDGRPDVLVWQTEPLTEDVVIAGDVVAKFFASTTASDADWIVKLIDVYPDSGGAGLEPGLAGYQLMVAADVLRGRFRNGFERPEPMKPGEVTGFTVDLLSHSHAFLKGHRIMVQLQSTWFPLIDRNPQKFVPNIFEAEPEDFVKATHRIYRSPQYPSHVVLPVEAPAADYDIVIRNGRVLDGSGGPWIAADVAIKDGRFVKIGVIEGAASRTIDARGRYVTPGWIDSMDQSGSVLPKHGLAENKLMEGVTTAIGGEGGTPVEAAQLPQYFKSLEGRISLNFGTYYSEAQARVAVLGYVDRAPNPEELDRMKALMELAMKNGALGMTTALIYPPSSYASTAELIEMAKVAARHGGIYASHIRGEGAEVVKSIDEAIEIGEKAGLPVEIFHLKVGHKASCGLLMGEAGRHVDAARTRGVDVAADLYLYTAGGTGLAATIPSWAFDGGNDALLKRLADPAIRTRLKSELKTGSPGWWNIIEAAGGWDGVVLANAQNKANARFHGKSITEIAKLTGKDPADAAWDLVAQGDGRVMAIYHMMCEPDIETALRFPWTAIGSDAGAVNPVAGSDPTGLPHPRAYGNFPRLIARYVRDRKALPLEDAVRKMTGWPATRLRIPGRGFIKEGLWADVVIFDYDHIQDRSTYEQPTLSPDGIDYVLVNGQVVVDHGKHTGATPGQVIRR